MVAQEIHRRKSGVAPAPSHGQATEAVVPHPAALNFVAQAGFVARLAAARGAFGRRRLAHGPWVGQGSLDPPQQVRVEFRVHVGQVSSGRVGG